MSDHIPFELQVDIIKRLPIKLLIQARSVSKAWKSVIDSPDFIADYTVHNHDQPQHLLIRYENLYSVETYVSFVDDDSSPQNKYSPTVPRSVNLLSDSIIIGTSHGLVCLFGCYLNPGHSRKPTAVIWNPSIRKSVAIALPNLDMRVAHALGFGVCPVTSDPKIVKISGTRSRHMKMKGVTCSSRWQVEVFSLRSGVWRNSYGNLSNNLVNLERPHSQVTIDGSIYWFGVGNTVGSDTEYCFLISFDLLSEEFGEIHLPNELAFRDKMELHLFNYCDSLAVIRQRIMDDMIQVWRKGNGDSKSFIKLFTFKKPYRYRWYMSSLPLGFRMTGELMMRKANNDEDSETLIDYDLFSHHINDLGIESECSSLLVCSYKESLILLDQPDI
ncbi:putative F-box domain, galactose oxidase/kelch, beta-propeller, F-box associated interaction [Helianthus annuus]|nr:putative F-box domain, galactose oxidase/kelch, beta-propeller, F-box associated interaction [Helianthus annuus]